MDQPLDIRNFADVLKMQPQLAKRAEEQLQRLRKARPEEVPVLAAQARGVALDGARAALAQLESEREAALQRLDERIEIRRREVTRLEAALRAAEGHAAEVAAQVAAAPPAKPKKT